MSIAGARRRAAFPHGEKLYEIERLYADLTETGWVE
jgi:hypothetical protein